MRADFSLDYNVLTVEQPQKLYLMARFEAGTSPDEALRRPLNLSLVIDRSGSMAGDKIDYTRQAAQFLVQHLGANDLFSIVLYNDKVETLLPPEQVSNKDSISQLLDRIHVRGTTNLSGGWLEGCMHVTNHLSSSSMNRVILMTDGLANRGVTDTNMLVTMAKQKYGEGVSTTAMGLGKDFNEDLMMEMANAGGGAFYFVESPEVTPEIFKEELTGLLSVVGQNLTISITPHGNEISSLRQLNAYPVDIQGQQTQFRLGDIFANEVKTLVLELSIPALKTLGQISIATLRFEYDEIIGETTKHHSEDFDVKINIKEAVESPDLNVEVQESVLLLQAANARRDAVREADKGNYQEASQILRAVAQSIDDSQVMNSQLKEEKDALIAQANKLEKGADAYTDYNRKTMSTQALYTMTNRHDDTVMLRSRELKRDKPSQVRITSEQMMAGQTTNATAIVRQSGVPPKVVQYKENYIPIDRNIIRIGRSSHNELIIDQKGVSRFHGQLRIEDGKVYFEDLGSTNGSTINGQNVTEPYELSVGDIVMVCDESLIFHNDNKK
ncbi:MAG: VWA domain-containing protein [Chloroflexota bacterium]